MDKCSTCHRQITQAAISHGHLTQCCACFDKSAPDSIHNKIRHDLIEELKVDNRAIFNDFHRTDFNKR